MFFIISKILAFLYSPITWIFILLIFSLIFRNSNNGKKILIITIILFYFFSNSFIIDKLISYWEVPIVKELDKNYDFGIVLGGGMVTIDSEDKRLVFRNNVDRIMQTIELFKKGKIKKILISGGSGSLIYRNMIESELLKTYLKRIDIPDSAIIIDSLSENTYQNAAYTAKILKKYNAGSKLLLITSSFHIKRALACFKKAGINPDIYPTNKITGIQRYDIEYLFLPSVTALGHWELYNREVIGYFVYKLKGYL